MTNDVRRFGRTEQVRQRRRTRSSLVGIFLLACSLILAILTARAYLEYHSLDPRGALAAFLRRPSGTPTLTSSPGAAAPTATPAMPPRPLPAGLTLTARSSILIDAQSGAVLYENNADQPLPPASTAKIVTALVVIRYARPEEVVTIQPVDLVDPTQESNMGLQAGDTVTVHDLLVGMLLPSGNDAAKALARFVGERLPGAPAPPVDRFVAEMNAEAARLGMTGSHFAQPAGEDAAGQVVTARGLALAAKALLEQPALLPIVAMPRANVRVGGAYPRVIALTNTNELLSQEGVYGVKTGTTSEAGQSLVVAYRTQHENVIGVILDSQDRYADARALLGIQSNRRMPRVPVIRKP